MRTLLSLVVIKERVRSRQNTKDKNIHSRLQLGLAFVFDCRKALRIHSRQSTTPAQLTPCLYVISRNFTHVVFRIFDNPDQILSFPRNFDIRFSICKYFVFLNILKKIVTYKIRYPSL